jgi:hypothetical protein
VDGIWMLTGTVVLRVLDNCGVGLSSI